MQINFKCAEKLGGRQRNLLHVVRLLNTSAKTKPNEPENNTEKSEDPERSPAGVLWWEVNDKNFMEKVWFSVWGL